MDLSILIVDPDAIAAAVTAALIHQMAPTIAVQLEPNPMEALLHMKYPTALIIDPEPDEQGSVALIEQLRKNNPLLRVLVVASWLTAALRSRLWALGVEEMEEKPALVGGRLSAFVAGVIATTA